MVGQVGSGQLKVTHVKLWTASTGVNSMLSHTVINYYAVNSKIILDDKQMAEITLTILGQ